MIGDNGSVVTSASIPESPLCKRHQALAYHYTREAISSGAIDFRHIPGEINPADILSKHWGYAQIWVMLRAVMFWAGNTSDLLLERTPLLQQEGSKKCPASTGSNSNPTGGTTEPPEARLEDPSMETHDPKDVPSSDPRPDEVSQAEDPK